MNAKQTKRTGANRKADAAEPKNRAKSQKKAEDRTKAAIARIAAIIPHAKFIELH
jgi:hypothetical protein